MILMVIFLLKGEKHFIFNISCTLLAGNPTVVRLDYSVLSFGHIEEADMVRIW